jgi:hypothetical protein
MIGLGFLGAALDRNRKGLEDAEVNRRVLEKVRAGHH